MLRCFPGIISLIVAFMIILGCLIVHATLKEVLQCLN